MIEVFKTNVGEHDQARKLVDHLTRILPGYRINFDLEDCDKVLRIEGGEILPDTIIRLVNAHGFQCHLLD